MKCIAMIPARMGSQRLPQKNLQLFNGIPLAQHAIRRAKASGCFDEIWLNSESNQLEQYAMIEKVNFHKRPEHLGNNTSTSEDYTKEFLNIHTCDYLFQVHTIAPLLHPEEITNFANIMTNSNYDTLLSVINEQIECAHNNIPVNFNYQYKTNSQDIKPIQRITWSITGWKASTFMLYANQGKCATYCGNIGYCEISRLGGHIIKTEYDLEIAERLKDLAI